MPVDLDRKQKENILFTSWWAIALIHITEYAMTVFMAHPGKGLVLRIPPPHWARIRTTEGTLLLMFCPVTRSYCSGNRKSLFLGLFNLLHKW